MSAAFLKQNISDSEDDEDYVPPTGQESDSEESNAGANAQTTIPTTVTPVMLDEEERKRARDALWSSFQQSVKASTTTADQQTTKQPKMIKIERRYLFAGEEVREVVEVAEDSPDAKKWPLWTGPNEVSAVTTETLPPLPKDTTDSTTSEPKKKDDPSPASASSAVDMALPPAAVTTPSDPKPLPANKKPGPRKPKVTLAPLPGSTKAKKLTTLDKSAMDWNAHLQAESASGSAVTDQLVANRKGGGYLEKVEFLKRVDERKDETLESLKSAKRRRL